MNHLSELKKYKDKWKETISLLILWNLIWGGFAIDQISTTLNHLNSTNTIQETKFVSETVIINSEIKSNKKQNEHIGTDDEELTESICFNEEFWSSVEAEITEDKRNFTISFPSIPKRTKIIVKLSHIILVWFNLRAAFQFYKKFKKQKKIFYQKKNCFSKMLESLKQHRKPLGTYCGKFFFNSSKPFKRYGFPPCTQLFESRTVV